MLVRAERLFGAYRWRGSLGFQGGSGSSDLHGTMLNVLAANTDTNSPDGTLNAFAAPRIGADVVLPLAFTAGLDFGYVTATGERVDQVGSNPVTTSQFPDGHAVVVCPRVGWVHGIAEWLAVWPRLGVTYAALGDTSGGDHSNLHFVALTVDPVVVLSPFAHVDILVGPSLDFGVGGAGTSVRSGVSQDLSASFSSFGGAVGTAIDI